MSARMIARGLLFTLSTPSAYVHAMPSMLCVRCREKGITLGGIEVRNEAELVHEHAAVMNLILMVTDVSLAYRLGHHCDQRAYRLGCHHHCLT